MPVLVSFSKRLVVRVSRKGVNSQLNSGPTVLLFRGKKVEKLVLEVPVHLFGDGVWECRQTSPRKETGTGPSSALGVRGLFLSGFLSSVPNQKPQ